MNNPMSFNFFTASDKPELPPRTNFYLLFVQFALLALIVPWLGIWLELSLPSRHKVRDAVPMPGSFQSYPALEYKPLTLPSVYNQKHMKPANMDYIHSYIEVLFQADKDAVQTQ